MSEHVAGKALEETKAGFVTFLKEKEQMTPQAIREQLNMMDANDWDKLYDSHRFACQQTVNNSFGTLTISEGKEAPAQKSPKTHEDPKTKKDPKTQGEAPPADYSVPVVNDDTISTGDVIRARAREYQGRHGYFYLPTRGQETVVHDVDRKNDSSGVKDINRANDQQMVINHDLKNDQGRVINNDVKNDQSRVTNIDATEDQSRVQKLGEKSKIPGLE